ncbi:MAG TPA: tryptophan 7-halogenase [Candidatus Polarisedimenticolia bacterium]|nr:tryptophan 7-halogenase [Candidatus Polarisedimenticolia bacterium]
MTPEAGPPADVAIIGGGPGGSTAASLLAAAGRRVVLFEKSRFPRFHIGESLLPFNMDLFRRLGVVHRLEAAFVEKWGAWLCSSDGSVTRYVRFEEGAVPGYPMAYQVLRSRFDEMLLRRSEELGAEVHQGATVVDASFSAREGCELTVADDHGDRLRRRARFLIDASGRDAFVASRRRLRRMTPHLRKAAVFAHFRGVPRAEGKRGGDIVLIVLKDGWFWMIPLPDGVTSVGLVTEGAIVKQEGRDPVALLEESLRRCPAARERMAGASRISQVWSASDYSYGCREISGDGYLLVGDAAAFIDPVFSSGVLLAMTSGEMAADGLHAAMGSDPWRADLSPRVFRDYERRVRRHVAAYMRIVSSFYRPRFMDIFLSPGGRFGMRQAVVSLLAGQTEPSALIRFRLALFYSLLRLQRLVGFAPTVPLLATMEEEKACRPPAA